MQQVPNKPGDVSMRVQMDTDEMVRLLKPVFEEVNAQRKRIEELERKVALLEEDSLSHFAVIAEFENKVARLEDDGR